MKFELSKPYFKKAIHQDLDHFSSEVHQWIGYGGFRNLFIIKKVYLF